MISKKAILEKMDSIFDIPDKNMLEKWRRMKAYINSIPNSHFPLQDQPKGEVIYPDSQYQPLFDHMNQQHGVTLLQDQMDEIIRVVKELEQPDLLPFQWPLPEGMEAVTRDGRKVGQLARFEVVDNDYYPVCGALDKEVQQWTINGKYYTEGDNDRDLFLRRVEKKVWVVEWKAHNGISGKNYFDTINEAEELCKRDERYHSSATIYEATLKPVV